MLSQRLNLTSQTYITATFTNGSESGTILRYDYDPYPVVSGEGATDSDAYTVSSLYPYSEPIEGGGNYVRNSVKVVIDAYDGSMILRYNNEDTIRVTNLYLQLFQPLEVMPADLKQHWCYRNICF